MSIRRRILQGLVAFTGSTLITNVCIVLQAYLTFRYLSVDQYGQMAFYLSGYRIGSLFLDFGMGGIFTSEIAKARGLGSVGRVRALWTTHTRLLLFTGSLLALIFGGIAKWSSEAIWGVMGAYVFLSGVNNGFCSLLLGHTRYRRTAAQSVSRSIARLGLLATLRWWWHGPIVIGVSLTYPLMELVTSILSLRMAWTVLSTLIKVPPIPVDLRALLRQKGVYVILMLPVKRALGEMPVWFLRLEAGDVAVGLYSAAQRSFSLIQAIFVPLETIWVPLVSEQLVQAPERLRLVLRQAQKYTFWLTIIVVGIAEVGAYHFVILIAGPEYIATIPVLRWLMPLQILGAFFQYHRPLFYALGEQRWLLGSALFNLLTHTPLLWMGVLWNGAVGVAQVAVLHGIMALGARLWILHRLAPQLWISPLSVFQIEKFDRQLAQKIREQASLLLRGITH